MKPLICADCEYWEMGEFWGTNPLGHDHKVIVECKGWCLAKPNKRKRWNYYPATKCKLFNKRKRTGIIMSGKGLPTQEQLNEIQEFLEEAFNN